MKIYQRKEQLYALNCDVRQSTLLSKLFFSSALYDAMVTANGILDGISAEIIEHKGMLQLSGHVLLCEDNVINREIGVKLPHMVGLTADCAEDGQIAVEKFALSKPGIYDIVLMDIQMPVMDGLKAERTIRSLEHPLMHKACRFLL